MVSDGPQGTILRVHVTPGSRREELIHQREEIRVRLTAPPVRGQANRALVKLVARALGVPGGDVEIVSGASSRRKTIRVRSLRAAEVEARLRVFTSG